MELSCAVVRDLLALYHDGVCSPESRALVEAHLAGCEACRAELAKYDRRPPEQNLREARLLADTAKTWRKSRLASFFKGACAAAALACAACGAAYNLIGSHVEPDGTLVEAFGFIPLAWLFALTALVCGACWAVARRPWRRRP